MKTKIKRDRKAEPSKARSKADPTSPTPTCPRCGKAMTLVSQGFNWSSYACRSCGIGKVAANR